ncbi:MAG: dihydropteroate synthase [Betaproteobacteria bacterium]|nr:dihydropteroate synthase [Betaproteobacteria bacterium]
MKTLSCGRFRLPLNRPLIMGIVNLTPDSFSGDGLKGRVADALSHARAEWEAGADILDLGAESTRPGAAPVSLQEELDRLLPVLEKMRDWEIPISIDSYKPEVMRAALAMGASMINDINALRAHGALEIAAASDCGICLMHMRNEPRNMQQNPCYEDVLGEVRDFLIGRVLACRDAGIAPERLLLDPGFGFGKNLLHNVTLFRNLQKLTVNDLPLLVGVCKKRMIGELTGGREIDERLPGSLAAAVVAAEKMDGQAIIIRSHDARATKDALAVWSALAGREKS